MREVKYFSEVRRRVIKNYRITGDKAFYHACFKNCLLLEEARYVFIYAFYEHASDVNERIEYEGRSILAVWRS